MVVVAAVGVAISMLLAPVAASKVLYPTVVPVPIAPLMILGQLTAITIPRIEAAVNMTTKMFMAVIPRSGPDENAV